MNTDNELITLFETRLRPRIEEMRPLVNKSKRLGQIGKYLILIAWVIFGHLAFYGNYMTVLPRVAASVAAFALAVWVTAYGMKHFIFPSREADTRARSRLRDEIVAEAYRAIFPDADYTFMRDFGPEDFAHSGLFHHNDAFSHNHVRGFVNRTPFAVVNASLSFELSQDSDGHSRTECSLQGLFYRLDLPKTLRHATLVQPKKMRSLHEGDRKGLRKADLGDPDFSKKFNALTSDTNDAQLLLTPPIRDAVRALGERSGKPLYLAFRDNRAYIALDYGRSMLQPEDSADTVKEDLLLTAALHRLAQTIAIGLERNTSSIWK